MMAKALVSGHFHYQLYFHFGMFIFFASHDSPKVTLLQKIE